MVNSKLARIVKTRKLVRDTETLLKLPRVWGRLPLAQKTRGLLIAQLHLGAQIVATMDDGGDYTRRVERLETVVLASTNGLAELRRIETETVGG